jgi:ankyrin repeat protein
LEAVKLLIEYGANFEIQDLDGATPLWKAATSGRISVIKALIDAGANINAANNESISPLYAAIRENQLDAARILIGAGSNLRQPTLFGDSPLLAALRYSAEESELLNLVIDSFGDISGEMDGLSRNTKYLAAIYGHAGLWAKLNGFKADLQLTVAMDDKMEKKVDTQGSVSYCCLFF